MSGARNVHVKVHNMTIEPAQATIGDRIKITTMSTQDKHTTDIKCDVAMAMKYHRPIDFCKGNSHPLDRVLCKLSQHRDCLCHRWHRVLAFQNCHL